MFSLLRFDAILGGTETWLLIWLGRFCTGAALIRCDMGCLAAAGLYMEPADDSPHDKYNFLFCPRQIPHSLCPAVSLQMFGGEAFVQLHRWTTGRRTWRSPLTTVSSSGSSMSSDSTAFSATPVSSWTARFSRPTRTSSWAPRATSRLSTARWGAALFQSLCLHTLIFTFPAWLLKKSNNIPGKYFHGWFKFIFFCSFIPMAALLRADNFSFFPVAHTELLSSRPCCAATLPVLSNHISDFFILAP